MTFAPACGDARWMGMLLLSPCGWLSSGKPALKSYPGDLTCALSRCSLHFLSKRPVAGRTASVAVADLEPRGTALFEA